MSRTATSRQLALETLCDWADSGRPLREFFDRRAGATGLADRDRHLALALVQTVLRRMEELDHVLTSRSSHPLARMRTRTLMALRLGAAQILFFDRIPGAAAVNETVHAFRKGRQPRWLAGFVNGVLRALVRNREQIMGELAASAPFFNHPPWLVHRWQERFGPDTTLAICRAASQVPPLVLWANTRKIDRDGLLAALAGSGIAARACRYADEGIVLGEYPGGPAGLPGYDRGWFQVQAEAPQLAARLLAMRPGGRYLDGCAGLGGKTAHLARLLPAGAALDAVEPDRRRFNLLTGNLSRLGLADRVQASCCRLEEFRAGACYDGILLDVPCSGTGITGRQPDIRWNRQPADIERNHRLQLRLLTTAARLLRPGGSLVYATCSLEYEENQGVVADFLTAHPGFRRTDCRALLPPAAAVLVDRDGFFAPTPADGLDGFFSACLVRAEKTASG